MSRGRNLQRLTITGLTGRLRDLFPDREFYMRSGSNIRFIKVSGRVQMLAAGSVVALGLVWIASVGIMTASSYFSARDRLSLLDREAKVTTAESRVSAYRGDLGKVTTDLQKRQDFIEKMVESHLGDLPADARKGETVTDSALHARLVVGPRVPLRSLAANAAALNALLADGAVYRVLITQSGFKASFLAALRSVS